ncbi:MAG: hypothetical protein WBZ37_22415 [Mycobacterium sp.]
MSVSHKMQYGPEQLRLTFERCLKAALTEGVPAHSEHGMGWKVEKAILAVALAYPDGAALEAKARRAFELALSAYE